MLKRFLSGLVLVALAVLTTGVIAYAVIDGENSSSQRQTVAVGQLKPGMATGTGTTVTINAGSGVITTAALTTAAGATQAVTLTNDRIVAGDIVFAQVDPGASTGTPVVASVAVTASTATILVQNIHASAALNAAIKVYFLVLKSGNSN